MTADDPRDLTTGNLPLSLDEKLAKIESLLRDALPVLERAVAERAELLTALQGTLDRWIDLVNSGDAGNWDPETEPHVIAARAAISKATSK
jgi:hypothetical protein